MSKNLYFSMLREMRKQVLFCRIIDSLLKESMTIKGLFFAIFFSSSILAVSQPNTMNGTVVGGNTENNACVIVGQVFSGYTKANGYEISSGIAQTQLVREKYNVVMYEGDSYNMHGFSYPSTTPAGEYNERVYIVHGANYNYDFLKTLKLKVLPPFSCGDIVYDADFNPYSTVYVAGFCWTQSNLRPKHYVDGGASISKALVYYSDMYPNVVANESTYGRLYTWYSAVGVPESSTASPTTDIYGNVQGICPYGWHIPKLLEINALCTISAEELNVTDLWLEPNSNTNSTGFSAKPAGIYNSFTYRFENLRGETRFWSMATEHIDSHKVLSLFLSCSTPLLYDYSNSDAYSVRCVKNY